MRATRAHLWADKFDGSLEDVFALQDGVTENVVGALAPKPSIRPSSSVRGRKPPDNLDAYDYRASRTGRTYLPTHRPRLRTAIPLLTEALRLDPQFMPTRMHFFPVLPRRFSGAPRGKSAQPCRRRRNNTPAVLLLSTATTAGVLTYAGWSLLIMHDVARGRAAT